MRICPLEIFPAPRAESGPIFNFYMGKNTPERKDNIMDRLVVRWKNSREANTFR
ncbi:MAG: hypothetical protein WDN00_06185 [Limisphaerales bacterium]